jgi:hypothetical protein
VIPGGAGTLAMPGVVNSHRCKESNRVDLMHDGEGEDDYGKMVLQINL